MKPIRWYAGRSQANTRTEARRQLMLDQSVQGALIGSVIASWLLCLFSMALFALCWHLFAGPRQPGSLTQLLWNLLPAMLGSLVVLPAAIDRMLRVSNRFAGPVHRLRHTLQRLNLGDRPAPLETRPGDEWQDLTEAFNRWRCTVERGQAKLDAGPGQEP